MPTNQNDYDERVFLRVPAGTADRAQALLDRMRGDATYRGMSLSRASVLRSALLDGLERMEAQTRRPAPTGDAP